MSALIPGQTIRHYQIRQKIGTGGMGVVYLARDMTLDRDGALKILPPDLAADSDRRVRFKFISPSSTLDFTSAVCQFSPISCRHVIRPLS